MEPKKKLKAKYDITNVQDLGVVIKAIRNSRGLSQRKFAIATGVDRSQLRRLEAAQLAAPVIDLVNTLLGSTGYGVSITRRPTPKAV